MAKQITDNASKSPVAQEDILLVRDVTSNTDKKTTVAGLATAVAANFPDGSIPSRKIKPTTFYVETPDIAPVNSTGPTDVSGSSVTLTADVASYLMVSFAARQQRNVNDTQFITLNIDGTDISSVQLRGASSNSVTADTSRSVRVPLAVGSHTIKLRYGCNSIGNGVMTAISWTGLLVAQ